MRNNNYVKSFMYSVFVMIIFFICFISNSENVKAAENDVVYIPDENLKALLNSKLGVKDETADITEAQMAKVGYLTIELYGEDAICDITGLSYCTRLLELYIEGDTSTRTTVDNKFTDELKKLNAITEFSMRYINCDDYTFMENWNGLTDLAVKYCNINIIPNLSKCTELEKVYIDGCKELVDISGLAQATNITQLNLDSCNALTDISSVSHLKKLESISLRYSAVKDISSIKGLTSLSTVDLARVEITDANKDSYMETIASLINVEDLDLSYCGITDEHTSMMSSLTKLNIVRLSDKITDIKFLLNSKDTLKKLNIYGCELDNEDISDIEQLANLKYLSIGYNAITDYSFINKLSNITLELSSGNSYTQIPYFTKPSTYVIENKVKGIDGNYVAPLESDLYEYNSETNEITVFVDKCTHNSANIKYKLSFEDIEGKVYNITHTEYVVLYEFTKGMNVEVHLEEEAVLKINSSGNSAKIECQWYKDGQKIEGATGLSLNIKNAKLTDAGNYTAVIKMGDYSVTSRAINLSVKTTKRLKVTLEINNESGDYLYYLGESVTFKINVENGSGDFIYYVGQIYEKGGSSAGVYNNTTGSIRLDKVGKVTIYASVHDKEGNYVDTYSNDIEVNVYEYEPIEGNLTIESPTWEPVVFVGDTIKLNVESTGGCGAHIYRYEVKNLETGEIEVIKDYTTDTSLTIKELSFARLQYTVYIKDSLGKVVATNSIKVYVLESLLDADFYVNGDQKNTEVMVGSEVELEVKATGGSQEYYYEAIVYDVSLDEYIYIDYDWTIGQNNYSWIPEHHGVYYVGFIVYDSVWNEIRSYDMDKFIDFEGDMEEYIELMDQEMFKIIVYREPGLYKADNGKWYYYVNDEIDKTYTGLAKNDNGWWYVKDGTVDFSYTGMAKNENGWFYVKNGKVDLSYTGLAENQYGTWYMVDGKVASNISGLTKVSKVWLYLTKGKVDTRYTGLAKNEYGWWYVKNGELDKTYTGMAKNENGWFYVKSGKVDLTYTGLAENQYGTWYMVDGKLASDISGLTKISKKWMYLVKGKVDTDYVGLAKNESGWWYVKNGTVDFTYTGMARNQYGWWYVTKGQLDRSFTGIASNEYGNWYIKNGTVEKTYTGTVKYNGITYSIKNGKVV